MLGDLNERYITRDTMINKRGKVLVRGTKGSRMEITAPERPMYHTRWQTGYSISDLVWSNVPRIEVRMLEDGAWAGTSDH